MFCVRGAACIFFVGWYIAYGICLFYFAGWNHGKSIWKGHMTIFSSIPSLPQTLGLMGSRFWMTLFHTLKIFNKIIKTNLTKVHPHVVFIQFENDVACRTRLDMIWQLQTSCSNSTCFGSESKHLSVSSTHPRCSPAMYLSRSFVGVQWWKPKIAPSTLSNLQVLLLPVAACSNNRLAWASNSPPIKTRVSAQLSRDLLLKKERRVIAVRTTHDSTTIIYPAACAPISTGSFWSSSGPVFSCHSNPSSWSVRWLWEDSQILNP